MKKEHAGSSAVYGLGMIGSLIYFLQSAHSLDAVILGIVKSIVWPGVFVYEIFKFLHL